MPETPVPTQDLSPEQQAAVDWSGGPLIVLAGPGTGKTRVIIHRIARLIKNGVPPDRIVAVTFTVKAAAQLRDRLAGLVDASTPGAADRVAVHTFHGFGFRLLTRFGDALGLPPSPELIDSAQTSRLLRQLVRENGLFRDSIALGRDSAIAQAQNEFEAMQNQGVDVAEAERFAADWIKRAAPASGEEAEANRAMAARFADTARLFWLFERERRRLGWLNFGDLIALPTRLLREHSGAAAIIRSDYRHFIVDEYQDSNAAQLALLAQLAPSKDADLCVVGDDDQSIYGFRGADDRAFEHFRAQWPSSGLLRLSENRRSIEPIVKVAGDIISRAYSRFAPDKVIRAVARSAAPGGGVEAVRLADEKDDGVTIAAMLLADRQANPDRDWSNYAVIAHSHLDLDRIASALELEGVPVERARERSAIDEPGVQDAMAWINLLAGARDSWAVRRLLIRPPLSIDPYTVTRWEQLHRAQASRASDDAGFIAWLGQHQAEHPGLARFLTTHGELKDTVKALTADSAISTIVLRTDVAHADLPAGEGGRPLAARIEALASLLRFARERQSRLDPPGDLASFLRYHADLDKSEQGLGSLGQDRVEDSGDQSDDERPQAVTLTTAHSAKGLEFDTVFVPRVHPPHGYPKKGGQERTELPEGLVSASGETRSVDEQRIDEERRLFYVACTRAERRLVLLAKANKSPSRSTHFFEELTLRSSAQARPVVHEAADVMDRAAEVGIRLRGISGLERDAEGKGGTGRSFAQSLARARAQARRSATLALESADRPDLDGAELDAITAALRDAAARMAIAAGVERSLPPPAWADASHRLLVKDLDAGRDRSSLFTFQKVSPPIELSFTSIKAYLDCPRCWYVRNVMGVREAESREISDGTIVHRVLERHFDRVRKSEAGGQPPPSIDDLIALAKSELDRSAGPTREIDPEQSERIIALARTAVEKLHDKSSNILELEHDVRFSYTHTAPGDSGVTTNHSFVAKMDRVEQTAGGLFRVIDYKTGYSSKALKEPAKDDLQLGIYAMAMAFEFNNKSTTPPAGVAEYWILSTGERGTIDLAKLDLVRVRSKIDEMITGVLTGEFGKGKACRGGCDFLGTL
ncbi:MAG: ATP-dependent DNA helicase [Planctomycetota bacterium]